MVLQPVGGGQRADRFSRYGYRVPGIRQDGLEADGFQRLGGLAKLGYDAGDGVRVEVGALVSRSRSAYDAAFGTFPGTPSEARQLFSRVYAKLGVDSFGGQLVHSLQVYANQTDRTFLDVSYGRNQAFANTFRSRSNFVGERVGAEYQATLKLGAAGTLAAGGRYERESVGSDSQTLAPVPGPHSKGLGAAQETVSAFALYELPVTQRLTLSLGGRVDGVVWVDTFATVRATAAYLIQETGTKLRGSVGTGARAPSLFTLYAPTYGNPDLRAEKSVGLDAGVDQTLWGGRVRLSATGFYNDFDDLIDFDFATSRYFNVARAQTYGAELSADMEVLPRVARLRAAYTYLQATDLNTGQRLARRAPHTLQLSAPITPIPELTVEPRVTVVSSR